MYVTDLVRIHEARIAHHVAAVSQVNGQYRSTPKFDVRSSVTMNRRVFGCAKVAAKKQRFNSSKELGISCHHVIKLPVFRTSFTHDDVAVDFQNLCFDFTRMLMHQGIERGFAGDHGVSNFFDAGGTKTISLAWKAKWRRRSLVGFQQGRRRPFRVDGVSLRQSAVY